MADEFFQAGVYGESWWNNSTRSNFSLSSPCASSTYDPIGQYFAWPSEFLDMNNRPSDDYSSSDDSMVLQELAKNDHNLSMDSTLQILGIGNSSSPSSASPDWNQPLQEDLNSSQNCQQENGVDCHKLKRNFSSITEDSSSNSFIKPINQDFTYYSDLLQTLFDNTDTHQSLFANNNQPNNYSLSSTNHRQNLNDFAPPLAKQTRPNQLSEIRASLPDITSKSNIEEVRQSKSSSLTKNSISEEPAYKRQRIETPSSLPTFKVRKEKLGDRITALQQLVSPFGKTDTASVLQEAIEYINFLHDQVNVLSTPYMKNGSVTQHQQVNEQEGQKQGLRRRGLCLVPISSTFPVAAETTIFGHQLWEEH
ncbi:transcription factor bHLH112-like [Lycium ferocissimum]|uniref:transcription factor bHLH112-like n=1 Tax=Lycium ferocissimum TaxID=112874 RepID=UPI0028151C98|nr:transcription factor bHLH112-like [Lycium ferocissimum]